MTDKTRQTKAPDTLDWKLVSALTEDGQASAGTLAEELGVTGPTVRSRLKGLIREGMLRVAGLVNLSSVRGLTVALVGITLTTHKELRAKMDQIAALPGVHWVAVVTGRYDILVEVVLSDEMGDLFHFLDQDLSSIGGVASSESFVVMKARRKWLLLPRSVRQRLAMGLE